jgi:hypothetical protein
MSTGAATIDRINVHAHARVIAADDVREVMGQTTLEIQTVCNAAARAARDFNVDNALVDCSLLALNNVITAIRLQLYFENEIVREHTYRITDEPLDAFGPGPDRPPAGPVSLPEGARIRLVVTRNDRKSAEYCDNWFRRLGWTTAKPLFIPPDARRHTYGAFVSGGFGIERQLLVNPKYDQPITAGIRQAADRDFASPASDSENSRPVTSADHLNGRNGGN